MQTDNREREDFGNLDHQGQSSGINARISRLGAAIARHIEDAVKNSRDPVEVKAKCIAQIERLLDKIRAIPV